MAMFKMAHDVFISHAHKDIEIAKAICRKLELARIGCWIAQRDILAGDDWTVATRKAISSSRVLLVLLSENANAATHIEREIAQAFYSKLSILPVRLSEAPLKRDFLFYLSDVRCFEASKLPEEQFLGPLVTSVKSMVQDNALASNALPGRPLPAHRNLTGFSDSWQGALQASHYRTLDIVKKVSVTVVILSAAWVFWYLYSSGKNDGPPADDGQHATGPAFVPSLDPTPRAAAEASPSKPEYTYSRFGLWVASKSTPTPVAQIGGPAAQSTTVSDSELSGTPNKVEREASAETANPVSNEGGEAKPAQEKTSDPTDRDEPATPAIHSSSTEKDELAESDASTGVAPQALHTPATPNSPVQPGAWADSKPSVEAVESILAAKPVPVAESTPSVESTPVSEPTPVAEASPSADPQPSVGSTPAAESTAVAEASPSADPQPTMESTPAAEPTPVAEASPSADPQPSVESTPTAESTAVAEASPSADPQPPLESTPTAESTAVAEATPFAETRPLSESAPAENTARPPDTGPLARSILAAQSTPPAELTAAVKSGEKSEAEVDDGSKPSSEEQSLKELVLDYLRTVAGDDNFAQEHLFGWRVNFYGKGLLPIAGVRASMDRYREEWPVRDWEPEGEPEFPGDLHAIHPELFEVLQPFSWKVANGSRRKTGRATLYVRIRRDEKGSFHIIHLELRHPDENSAR
jgi:hypothetical protein